MKNDSWLKFIRENSVLIGILVGIIILFLALISHNMFLITLLFIVGGSIGLVGFGMSAVGASSLVWEGISNQARKP